MSSRDIKQCDLRLQTAWSKAVTDWNNKKGLIPSLSCTYRSAEEQNRLYEQGRTTEGKIVTNAKAYQSPHNFVPSQAFDFFFQKDGKAIWNDAESYKEFRYLILSADKTLVSGASFKFVDADHIETPDWRTKQQLA